MRLGTGICSRRDVGGQKAEERVDSHSHFLISRRWIDAWAAYVEWNPSDDGVRPPHPGPIRNCAFFGGVSKSDRPLRHPSPPAVVCSSARSRTRSRRSSRERNSKPVRAAGRRAQCRRCRGSQEPVAPPTDTPDPDERTGVTDVRHAQRQTAFADVPVDAANAPASCRRCRSQCAASGARERTDLRIRDDLTPWHTGRAPRLRATRSRPLPRRRPFVRHSSRRPSRPRFYLP